MACSENPIVKVHPMKNPLILSLVLLLSYSSFSQPGNDLCSSATTLTVGPDCSPIAGTLYNSTSTTTTGTGNCGTRRDVWYRFQVPANSTSVKITIALTSPSTPLTTSNTYIELLNGNNCPATGTSICLEPTMPSAAATRTQTRWDRSS